MQKSTTSQIIYTMEKNGLIIREKVDYDKRTKKIVLTNLALMIKDEAKKEINQLEQNIVQGLTEEEIEQFYYVVDKIKKNIQDKEQNLW